MTTVNPSLMTTVTDANFDAEVRSSSQPVLVDFWAEWCGPCRAVAPVLEEVAAVYSGRLKVTKLNIDENVQTPSRFGVRAIPTLVLFKDGEIKETIVGAQPKSQLLAVIEPHL